MGIWNVIKSKYWDNFDSNDQDFLFSAFIVSLVLLVFLYLCYYCFDAESNGKNTLFFLKSFGTLFTITGVLYAIHIQLKLKLITEQLKDNTKEIHDSIAAHYVSSNILKAISLSNEVEQSLISKNYAASIVLIRILKETLTECKKSFFNDFEKELTHCIKCLDDNNTKSLEEIVNDCKQKCNYNILEKLNRHNKNLSIQLVHITTSSKEKSPKINVNDGLAIVDDLRQILNEIKPSPIKSL